MPKKKKKEEPQKPQINKDLEGFDIHINEFGEIVSNRPIDTLNDFLDENVKDKKLIDRKSEEE